MAAKSLCNCQPKLLALCKGEECNSLPALDRLNVELGSSLFVGTKVLLRRCSCDCACGLMYVCCVWADIEKKAEVEALKSTLRGRSSFGAGSKKDSVMPEKLRVANVKN